MMGRLFDVVLDFYACEQSGNTCFDDRIWMDFPKASTKTDQFALWIPDKNVNAEYGHMDVCPSVSRKAMDADWMGAASAFISGDDASVWKRRL